MRDDAWHSAADLLPYGVKIGMASVPGILMEATFGAAPAQPGVVVNVQGQDEIALAEPRGLPGAGNMVL